MGELSPKRRAELAEPRAEADESSGIPRGERRGDRRRLLIGDGYESGVGEPGSSATER